MIKTELFVNHKITRGVIIIALLFLIGSAAMALGIILLGTSEIRSGEIVFSESDNPIPQIKRWHAATPEDKPSSFKWININFRAMDYFAAGYPIDYIFEAKTREPDGVQELYIIFREPSDTIRWVNQTNVQSFLELERSLGNVIELSKKSSDEFYISDSRKFLDEREYGISALALSKEFGVEPIDLTEEILSIESPVEKIKLDNNRISAFVSKAQIRSSFVIEGLSYILVGWIPLQLAIQFLREKNKIENDMRNSLRSVISELKDTQNYLSTWDKSMVKIDGTVYHYTGISFSTFAFENLIHLGVFQEIEHNLQIKISNLYLEIRLANDLSTQIEQLLSLGDVHDGQFNIKLSSLSESYKGLVEKIMRNIDEMLPKLENIT